MTTEMETTKFCLGSDIYVILSEFKQFPSIGFRKCVTRATGILITRTGVNMIKGQYDEMMKHRQEIAENLDAETVVGFSLPFDVFIKVRVNNNNNNNNIYKNIIDRQGKENC